MEMTSARVLLHQHCDSFASRGQLRVVRDGRTLETPDRGLVDAHGQGCCCYDAMATAPWEACEELSEFFPQLERSSRRQSAQDTDARSRGLAVSTATQTGPRPCTLDGNTRPGVCVSPAASLVMTPGEIPHTSVRRCSKTGEAATPCSPSFAPIN